MDMAITDISVSTALNKYTRSEYAAKRMLCARGVFAICPRYECLTVCKSNELTLEDDIFEEKLLCEIESYLNSYSQKLLLLDCNGSACLCVPGLYPASSLGIMLRFNIESARFWRIAQSCGCDGLLKLSEHIKLSSVRMTEEMSRQAKLLKPFFEELRACFFELDRLNLCFNYSEKLSEIYMQCQRLAYFTGCPVQISCRESKRLENDLDRVDFSLLTALCLQCLWRRKRRQRTEVPGLHLTALVTRFC